MGLHKSLYYWLVDFSLVSTMEQFTTCPFCRELTAHRMLNNYPFCGLNDRAFRFWCRRDSPNCSQFEKVVYFTKLPEQDNFQCVYCQSMEMAYWLPEYHCGANILEGALVCTKRNCVPKEFYPFVISLVLTVVARTREVVDTSCNLM